MPDDRLARVKAGIDAFGRGDVPEWRALVPHLFTDDAEWHSSWTGHVNKGHEEIANWLELMMAGFTDFRIELDHIEDLGETVLSCSRFHGILAVSGVVADRKVGTVWEFEGAKCRRISSYAGWEEARAAAAGTAPSQVASG